MAKLFKIKNVLLTSSKCCVSVIVYQFIDTLRFGSGDKRGKSI